MFIGSEENQSHDLLIRGPGTVAEPRVYDRPLSDAEIKTLFQFKRAGTGLVVADNIVAGAISTAKLAANAVTANKIQAGAITADKIETNAVVSRVLAATALNFPGDAIAYWPLDDSKPGEPAPNLVKDVKSGFDGTLNGSPQFTSGISGRALSFILSNQSLSVNPTHSVETITISFWHKWEGEPGEWRTVIASDSGGIQHFAFDENRNAVIYDGVIRNFLIQSPSDTWHHYVLVIHSQTSALLFVDGIERAEVQTTLNIGSDPVRLIGNWNGGDRPAGTIAEPRIYDRALDASEVKTLYQFKREGTGLVVADNIVAEAITAEKIAVGAITAEKIAVGAVTAEAISVVDLESISASMGTITAGVLQAPVAPEFFNINLGERKFFLGSTDGEHGISYDSTNDILWISGELSAATGTFAGKLEGGEINIGNGNFVIASNGNMTVGPMTLIASGSAAGRFSVEGSGTRFRVLENGGMYIGPSWNTAPFKVSAAGDVVAESIDLAGGSISGTLAIGTQGLVRSGTYTPPSGAGSGSSSEQRLTAARIESAMTSISPALNERAGLAGASFFMWRSNIADWPGYNGVLSPMLAGNEFSISYEAGSREFWLRNRRIADGSSSNERVSISKLCLKDLPTSDAGLAEGEVYRSGTYLRVKT